MFSCFWELYSYGSKIPSIPCDRSLSEQPISTRKAQSRKNKPTCLCAPREFRKRMYPPCIIIIKSCYSDYRIYKPFIAWSALRALFTWSRRTTCAKAHRLFFLNFSKLPGNQKFNNFVTEVGRTTLKLAKWHVWSTISRGYSERWKKSLSEVWAPLLDNIYVRSVRVM